MSETDLLPCPFCGAHGEELGLNRPSDSGAHGWFVRCYICCMETAEYPTEAETVAAWNRRAALAATPTAERGECPPISDHREQGGE